MVVRERIRTSPRSDHGNLLCLGEPDELVRGARGDDAATDELIAQATTAEQDSVDLYQFTRLLNGTLDEEGRARIIEMMWQVAYADGHVSEFQDNLIWRAADLLGVSSRERIALRQRIATSRKGAGG